jgi:hypothetical protein
MENLTVIIPVHIYDETVKQLLNKAITSVFCQKDTAQQILMVGPQNIINKIKIDFKNDKIDFFENLGLTDYCTQINIGVTNCKTKYFSILGFDDEYSETWFKNVSTYIKHKPEYSIFMPIVNYVDNDNNITGTVNEIIWAMSFSNEIGVIDEDTLQSYYDFSVNGAVFRTDDFIEVGMLKPSIKLSFWYEFLLRSANQGLKIYVIPKNGYFSLIGREGSIIDQYKYMDSKERSWWIKLAGKECFFKQERKGSYTYTPKKELSEMVELK